MEHIFEKHYRNKIRQQNDLDNAKNQPRHNQIKKG